LKVVIRSSKWWRFIQRWVKFHMVGLAGMCVHLTTLSLFSKGFGMEPAVATALAVEMAVLHNFTWHERYTWKDRCAVNWTDVAGRLIRFNLTTGMISLLGTTAIVKYLVSAHHLPVIIANVIAIPCCSMLNFLASDLIVFKKPASSFPGSD
jgi:putative flippase GtrA